MQYSKQRRSIIVLLGFGAIVLGAAQLGAFSGSRPKSIGVVESRLSPPSLAPNSVSSQAALYPNHPQRQYAEIAPLVYQGDGVTAMTRLRAVLERLDRTQVITHEPGYLYAQCATPLMRFVDDVEFALDNRRHVIDVRSASRIGHSDFGVNRERIEKIRVLFAGSPSAVVMN